jgi:hypothetical protein
LGLLKLAISVVVLGLLLVLRQWAQQRHLKLGLSLLLAAVMVVVAVLVLMALLPVEVAAVVEKLITGEAVPQEEFPLLIRQAVAVEIRGTITHSRQGDLWLRFGWM